MEETQARERLIGRLTELLDAHLPPGVPFEMRKLDDGSFDLTCGDPEAQLLLREGVVVACEEIEAGGWVPPFRWAWQQ